MSTNVYVSQSSLLPRNICVWKCVPWEGRKFTTQPKIVGPALAPCTLIRATNWATLGFHLLRLTYLPFFCYCSLHRKMVQEGLGTMFIRVAHNEWRKELFNENYLGSLQKQLLIKVVLTDDQPTSYSLPLEKLFLSNWSWFSFRNVHWKRTRIKHSEYYTFFNTGSLFLISFLICVYILKYEMSRIWQKLKYWLLAWEGSCAIETKYDWRKRRKKWIK